MGKGAGTSRGHRDQLSIAMVGTRGVPARYGGFETAVEEIGQRLVERGHQVRVYCRDGHSSAALDEYRGMELVSRPVVHRRTLETLSHTAASVGHLVKNKTDVAFLFNAANAPLLPRLRAARIPVATHVDGLEWKRAKWGPVGQRYYRIAEALSVRWSDALIADAQGIQDYYTEKFEVDTRLISYGAPILDDVGDDCLADIDVVPGAYHLVVARFEPENHVHLAVEGYVRSGARHPLLVVGSAPYADAYTARVKEIARNDPRVRFLGGVWDQKLLDQLYANALSYVHGHSVGGTNPSLLRAIGAGTATIAFDVVFNHEVLRGDGWYFATAGDVRDRIEAAEARPGEVRARGAALRLRATDYDWDVVADHYEQLARDLASGRSATSTRAGEPTDDARLFAVQGEKRR